MLEPATLLVIVVVMALAFDFINGFHDAANSIATVVSTRVLTPLTAVAWAAFFNFVAFKVFKTGVAKTISSDLVVLKPEDPMMLYVVLAGLMGAIIWNLLTWWWGLPSSSSHALIGGYAGAAITHAVLTALHDNTSDTAGLFHVAAAALYPQNWIKPLSFIILAPLMGLAMGRALHFVISHLCRNVRPSRMDGVFRKLQLVSAGAYSLGHGGNDAQKTMGIIAAALITTGHLQAKDAIPLWVVLTCHGAMGLGTLCGGWRIVHTMGQKLTKLQPFGGCCAETAGAATLFLVTHLKIPVSTTHVITGAIVGVGSARRLSAVRWGVAANIIWAWVLTIPLSAFAAALCFWLLRLWVR